MMAQRERVHARGRSIENEYRPVVRGFLDCFVPETLLRPDGPDGRFKSSKIRSRLVAGLERQVGSSDRAIPFRDAVTRCDDDPRIENDSCCTGHRAAELSDCRIGRQPCIDNSTMIYMRDFCRQFVTPEH